MPTYINTDALKILLSIIIFVYKFCYFQVKHGTSLRSRSAPLQINTSTMSLRACVITLTARTGAGTVRIENIEVYSVVGWEVYGVLDGTNTLLWLLGTSVV